MKLRLRENSIRLRLLRTEVARLLETGEVAEKIVFGVNPAETLIYAVRATDGTREVAARFAGNCIEILIPSGTAKNWAETDEVGLYAEQKIDDSMNLKISVEKDFVCTERPADADNRDTFPHPKMKC